MPNPPVRYTPDVEEIKAEERETIEGLNAAFDTILERTAEDYGHAVRSVHAKAHGVLEGELTVDTGLPPELAQGVFAAPGVHKVLMRLSTNAGDILPDAISLPRGSAIAVLTVVWSGALFGVALKTAWPTAPRWLGVPLYIALGWVAVFVMPDLLAHVGVAAFVLIVAGGVFYTVGAVVYGIRKPNPVPGVFGFHEVFHACTLVAATCHYIAVWLAVFA